jgi:NAD(P)-dependent dehydrogenase (short-subunit alcohol dehydrogenase family)
MTGRAASNAPVVAVVTGAAMGMGLAISKRLVTDRMDVIAVDVNAAALEQVRTELGDRYRPLVGDVGEWDTHERAANAAADIGSLRHWVNNAGIDIVGGAHEVTPQHIADGLRVCQLGVMYGCAIAVRRMLPARFGTIVNISSIQGVAAWPRYFVYDAAKAAILMATKSVALDYSPFGIRANVVLPGNIDTPMLRASLPPDISTEAGLEREAALAPMLRIGDPIEVAEVVAFLLSERSSFVNGAEVIVDGGAMVRCFPHPAIDVPPVP